VFDRFAPKLARDYHVYGITRRGFGKSTAAHSGYLSDSLADDVLAVMDSLAIRRPVLIGHSLAGQELSSIGSRHPELVAGLVYLDAGYQYAFFDSAHSAVQLSVRDTQRKLARLVDPAIGMSAGERGATIAELLQTSLPLMERDLQVWQRELASQRDQGAVRPAPQSDPVARAIAMGHQKYFDIRSPVLAIFAMPRAAPAELARDSAGRAFFDSLSVANLAPQIAAFERGIPLAHVVTMAHASHYVFRSHGDAVLRETRAFIAQLPTPH
jgi:pimeloyl-ACP methyl ester carboxylesterase